MTVALRSGATGTTADDLRRSEQRRNARVPGADADLAARDAAYAYDAVMGDRRGTSDDAKPKQKRRAAR
jgi:hypothetical protein